MRGERVAIHSTLDSSWPAPKRRHASASLIWRVFRYPHSGVEDLCACRGAVVGREYHKRVVADAQFFQPPEQAACVLVNVLDHSVKLRHSIGHLALVTSEIPVGYFERCVGRIRRDVREERSLAVDRFDPCLRLAK